MSRWIMQVIALTLATCSPLAATIFFQMDTTTTFSVRFSSHHQNRVAISEGRISKVICPEGAVSVHLEVESGQAFVYALTDPCPPTVISVISETGLVQDIEITFEPGPAQTVVFTQQPVTPSLLGPVENSGEREYARIFSLAAQVTGGAVPKGYSCVFQRWKTTRLGRGLSSRCISRLDGRTERVFVIEVQNCAFRKRRVLEEQLALPYARWIFLCQSCLDPKETTLALVAVER